MASPRKASGKIVSGPEVYGGLPRPGGCLVLVIMLGVVLAAVPGTLVADPFCGSGKVPAACKRLGRRGLACEIEPQTTRRRVA